MPVHDPSSVNDIMNRSKKSRRNRTCSLVVALAVGCMFQATSLCVNASAPEPTWESYHKHGKDNFESGNLEVALKDFQKALDLAEKFPENDPRRVEFNKLHRVSVRYEVAVLLLGLVGMYLLVREFPARP